ncbi:MAG: hypothetical protein GY856_26245, partial [bacterium]|nr:hypothetical protein [bacterium]
VQALQGDPGDGAIWFGTGGGGASRYDVNRGTFTTYTTADGLADNYVQVLHAEPGERAIWFGSRTGGASRYDVKHGTFTTYTTADGLADNYVLSLHVEPGDGAIWFGTGGGGASRYDLRGGTFTTYTTADGLAHNNVRALHAEPAHGAARKLAPKLKLPRPTAGADPREDAAIFAGLLAERFARIERRGVVLIDEADGLVETDAGHGYPLLNELRALESEGVCSFVLAGYWHLFRRTLEHGSPLYNFAPVRRLGPLDDEAARTLAREPMERLGLAYADPRLPARIVERTGGYPNLIQLLGHGLLEQLKKNRGLELTAAQLEHAERSAEVRDYLGWSFRVNTLKAGQVLVGRLLGRDRFTLAEAHGVLEEATGRNVPIGVLEALLVQLVLYGFVGEGRDGYRWTIPLLRETLLSAQDRDYRLERVIEELPADPMSWASKVEVDREPRAEEAPETPTCDSESVDS